MAVDDTCKHEEESEVVEGVVVGHKDECRAEDAQGEVVVIGGVCQRQDGMEVEASRGKVDVVEEFHKK